MSGILYYPLRLKLIAYERVVPTLCPSTDLDEIRPGQIVAAIRIGSAVK